MVSTVPILNELEYYNLNMTSKLSIYLLTKWALSQAWYGGTLPFTWKIQKFMLEKQMVHAIPVWELQKTWAKIWEMQFFPFFLLCSADLDYIHCSSLFSHHLKFFRVVCVNGKHSGSRTFFMGGGDTNHLAWLHFFGF